MKDSPGVMEFRRIERTQLLLSTIVLFLVASGICSFFIYATIEKLYSESVLEQYVFIGDKLRSEMQRENCPTIPLPGALSCEEGGKWRSDEVIQRLLDRYAHIMANRVGIAHPASTLSDATAETVAVSWISLDEKVRGSSDRRLRGSLYPSTSDETELATGGRYAHGTEYYDIRLPLLGPGDTPVATLAIRVPNQTIARTLEAALEQHKSVTYLVILGGAGLLTLAFGLCGLGRMAAKRLATKRTTALILMAVCATQFSSFVASTFLFDQNYPQFSRERMGVFSEVLQSNFERQVERGFRLTEIAKSIDTGRLTGSVVGSIPNPSYGSFAILDKEGTAVVNAVFFDGELNTTDVTIEDEQVTAAATSFDSNHLLMDLRVRDRRVGFLLVRKAESETSLRLKSLGIEAIIAITIALLCLVELLLLVFKYLEKRALARVDTPRPVHYGVIRPVIFLFLFGIDLSAALIPLQMERLYEPMLGLPKDVVLGLPVSAMFLMVGVTFLIAGAWMDRRGWHEPFIIGVLITGVSKFYAWLAPDAFQFVLAMSGIGFGYGLALMAAQGFVMSNTTDKEKAHGISYFFAGVYAGSIGGTAIGAMLAERLGYDLVFLLGSMFIFACFGCGVFFLRSTFRRPDPKESAPSESQEGKRGFSFVRFLLDRNVITLVLFCSIPSAVAVIGFLNYFSPVYLSRLGVSESIIGGVLTLYGISMVYISPFIGRWIDATERKDIFIVMGCGLGGCAFMGFHFLSGLSATIVAIIFLGLSMACLQASQTTYTLKLRATRRFGDGKAVAMVRATSRIGQMLGPMVFSGLVIADDTERAMTYFGLVYFVFAILFFALSKRETKDEEPRLFGEAVPATGENKG